MAGGNVIASVYPVVLCGGRGERLWPLSRDGRSKAFVSLPGGAGFAATVARARRWASGQLVVSGAASERAAIIAGRGGCADDLILLEPEGRNTAPAIAAAAVRIARHDPDGILLVLPTDHDFGEDDTPIAAAITEAVALAAAAETLVILGATPSTPASAFGYVMAEPPDAAGHRRVIRFVEKPSRGAAVELIAAGALWNAGLVIGRASAILAALKAHAPAVLGAAEAAVTSGREADGVLALGEAFRSAPAIAFDRAVLERARNLDLVPLGGEWRDLGSWSQVWAAERRDANGNSLRGDVRIEDSADVLAIAEPGVQLVVRGQTGAAVIATPEAVLVTSMPGVGAGDARPLGTWLRTAALPIWASLGWDEAAGVFREALSQDGIPEERQRRTRVQARQAYVYATAALDDLHAPWGRLARRGMETLIARGVRPDGLYAYAPDLGAGRVDGEALLYDQAFVLLALAALARLEPDVATWRGEADRLRGALEAFRHGPAFRERSDAPFQSNALMHLLEAAIAWAAITGDGPWRDLAQDLVAHALERMIDPETGAMGEVFDSAWSRPAPSEARLEPGHQFEWAWLLATWRDEGGEPRCEAAARRLYACGLRGVAADGAVLNSLDGAFRPTDGARRLWPQCERMRAAVRLGQETDLQDATSALARFLRTPVRGLWHERQAADGRWVDAPAPATSLYHLYGAITAVPR